MADFAHKKTIETLNLRTYQLRIRATTVYSGKDKNNAGRIFHGILDKNLKLETKWEVKKFYYITRREIMEEPIESQNNHD